MCEIRFNISAKDGKLEGMVNSIPSGIRTEVIKEALRYFLCDVRDRKVESNYIDAELLSGFKTDVRQTVISLDEMVRLLELRPSQPPIQVVATETASLQTQQEMPLQSNVIEEDLLHVNLEEEDDSEFDIDLNSNEFDEEIIGSVEITADFEDFNF